jgi:3-isopropylmalate/(R)-2-methylmalate dehydratase small subunit
MMESFTKLEGTAAPLPLVNVDTDKIIPAKWLKTIKRTGLGDALFETLRYLEDGSENPDFVLNREPYRHAEILIAGENFGCGSSREHAPWALQGFGIRCVIAPSFADIFFNNCFKNGILPVVLPQEQIDILVRETSDPEQARLTVDLEKQEVVRARANESFAFDVDPWRKHCLLNGLDDIGITTGRKAKIDDFEGRQRSAAPWLYRDVA